MQNKYIKVPFVIDKTKKYIFMHLLYEKMLHSLNFLIALFATKLYAVWTYLLQKLKINTTYIIYILGTVYFGYCISKFVLWLHKNRGKPLKMNKKFYLI